MSFEKAAKQIKSSLNSTSSLYLLLSSVGDLAKQKKNKGNIDFTTSLYTLQESFMDLGGSNPSIKNILNYLLGKGVVGKNTPEKVLERVSHIKRYLLDAEKKIYLLGEQKLNEKGNVFVFGHDSFLSGVLKYARSKGKYFDVRNTEMRPNFYGRKLAGHLAKGGISVNHYADSSLKRAISGVDVVFSDCVSILSNGDIVGVAGFDLVADVALSEGVPLYVCAPSWKINGDTFLSHATQNYFQVLWGGAPKGVKLNSPKEDTVSANTITGVISELGIYAPEDLVSEAKYENMWKFK